MVLAVPVVDGKSPTEWTATTCLLKALDPKALPRQLLYKSNIVDLLDDMAKSRVTPRLALVCQAAALNALRQALWWNRKKLRRGLDIGGGWHFRGAINSVGCAGVTAPTMLKRFRKTLESFNQKQFLAFEGLLILVCVLASTVFAGAVSVLLFIVRR